MQAIIDAKELKRMFVDLRPILKNSMDGGLLGFNVEDNQLIVTCKNGIIYERKFACDVTGPIYSTVIYRDIADMLPTEGLAVISVSEKSVEMRTSEFSTSFVAAYGEIKPYVRRCRDQKQCRQETYAKLASAFRELSPVSKSLKSESSVILRPPFAICKYPTIWLEVPFEGFSTSIGVRELRTIANFNPKYYAASDEAIEFFNGSALLAVPISPVGDVLSTKDILQNPQPPRQLSGLAPLEKALSFARTVKGACKLTYYTDGYKVTYKNQEVEMAFSVGPCMDPIYTLDTYTEYLQMLFRLTQDKTAYLTVASNAIMIEVPGELRLIHSIV